MPGSVKRPFWTPSSSSLWSRLGLYGSLLFLCPTSGTEPGGMKVQLCDPTFRWRYRSSRWASHRSPYPLPFRVSGFTPLLCEPRWPARAPVLEVSSERISLSGIPGLPDRQLPSPDIGALRFSRTAKTSIDGAIKGAYVMGASDGYSVGQTIGYAGGHVAGIIEGSVITSVSLSSLLFIAAVLFRAIRR